VIFAAYEGAVSAVKIANK